MMVDAGCHGWSRPALSRIRVDLNASIEQLEWTRERLQPELRGAVDDRRRARDRFGRRRIFMAGLGLFTVASALCALAPGIGWLIAAAGGAGLRRGARDADAMALLSAAYPPDRRGRALASFSGCDRYRGGGGAAGRRSVTQDLAWQWSSG